ncbi:TonB-dependent receptor [Bryocella elongata]|nr:TonB-dependent receptor [Bryocella elongata]
MRLRLHHRHLILLASALFSSAASHAQSGAGRVQGTVHDPAGNAVPHAAVAITSIDRGEETDVTSDGKGLFVAPPLPIGNYSIKVSSPGFATWEGHLTLRVDQVVDLEPKLTVGSDTQQITVEGDISPLVDNENQTIGSTLDYKRIQSLPENLRSVGNLIQLTTPGITGSESLFGSSQFKANGINANGFEFVQDGASLANQDYGGQSQGLPDPDTIGEVKVETSNSSAKFNRPATAVLSTKAGTNRFSGSLFETMRNNSFGIAKNRQDTFTTAPKLIRNEFGASLGGPVIIPKLYNGHDHTFFFVAFEGIEQRQASTLLTYVPTDAMRGGDFSGLVAANGNAYTIYDPATSTVAWTRTAFPNNQIPVGREAPLTKAVYAIMPHASNANNPLVQANLNQLTPKNDSGRTLTARVDHHFSDADSAFFRYTYNNSRPYAYGSSNYGPMPTNLEANVTFDPVKADSGSLTWNHVFSPRFFVESLLSDAYESDQIYTGPNPNVDYAAQFGLPSIGALGFPNIYGIGFMPYGFGRNDNTRKNSQNIAVWDENFSYVKGKHILQFGSRYRHERTWILVDQNPTPSQVNFSSLGTGLLNPTTVASAAYSAVGYTGNTNASFFLGDAQYYQVSQLQQWYHFRNQEIATYFQDDWKVTPKLTLNLGLRWEMHPALHEAQGLFGGYDFKNQAVITGPSLQTLYAEGRTSAPVVANFTSIGANFESAADAGLPMSLVYGNYHDFAPRVGFAYQLFGGKQQTVIRGGYGTYIYPPPTRNFYAETRQNPPYQATFQESYTNANQAPDGLPNYMLRAPQTVIAGYNSSSVVSLNSPTAVTRGSFGISGLDPHYPSTFVNQWNVTVEHSMPFSSAVRATYLGNHGSNLEQYWEYDDSPSSYVWFENTNGQALPTGTYANVGTKPYPTLPYGYIETQRKTGYSNDNQMQLEYQRLNKNGWGFQVFYVLSNAFRNGGNGWRDSAYEPASYFLNGAAPADSAASNRWQNYVRDLTIPQHEIRWNWLVDLPVGRNKHFFSGANRVVDEIIGGWQVSSTGHMLSQRFTPSTGYYEPTTLKLYKNTTVTNCLSGVCQANRLWFNGYIDANKINTAAGVTGVPTGYTPFNGPLIRTPADGGSKSDPNYNYYDTNTVFLTLAGSSTPTPVTYNPDIAPTRAMSVQGPFNWNMDASLFKVFPIHERIALRVNADFFNVLNIQGTNNPSTTTGLIAFTSSYWTARQLQLTARLNF